VAETGETAHVGVLRRGRTVSLTNVESPQTLRTPVTVGGVSPAHCTSLGKAILAFSPEAEIDEFIRTYGLKRYTRRTITRPAAFKRALKSVREKGYAVDDEEFEDGLKCIGAPVRDYTTKVVAAISITGPATRLTEDRMPALTSCIVKAAAELSAALGYPGNEEMKK